MPDAHKRESRTPPGRPLLRERKAGRGAPLAPAQREVLRLQRLAGNKSVNALLQDGPAVAAAPSSLIVAMRQPAGAATAPPSAATEYEVGGNRYKDDQFGIAVGQVVSLVDQVGGVLSHRRDAVAEFCGPGGAGAKAEASFTDQILTGVLMGLLGLATDGVGTVLEGMLEAGVASVARRVSIDPAVVASASKAIIKKSVDFAKDQAKERIPKAVSGAHDPKVVGGTELATSLATYASALTAALDADAEGMKRSALQQLLDLPAQPAAHRWAVAAALWESLYTSFEQVKRIQWNATSDGWFGLQTASGVDSLGGIDHGIVSILLTDDAYPETALTSRGAYLAGSGANEATLRAYNERKLGEIHLVKRLIMVSASLGRGIAPCAWEVDVSAGGDEINWVGQTRWGPAWLAAKHLGLRDLDSDSPQVTEENVKAGAAKVWAELSGKSAKDLGASFAVTGLTSGSAGWTAIRPDSLKAVHH